MDRSLKAFATPGQVKDTSKFAKPTVKSDARRTAMHFGSRHQSIGAVAEQSCYRKLPGLTDGKQQSRLAAARRASARPQTEQFFYDRPVPPHGPHT